MIKKRDRNNEATAFAVVLILSFTYQLTNYLFDLNITFWELIIVFIFQRLIVIELEIDETKNIVKRWFRS